MKILMAASYYRSVGGTQTLIREISRELKERGHVVDVLTLNFDSDWNPLWKMDFLDDDGIKVIKWPAKRLFRNKGVLENLLPRLFNVIFFIKPGLTKLAKDYDFLQFFDVNDLTFPFFMLRSRVKKAIYCATLAERFVLYKSRMLTRAIFKRSSDLFISSNPNTTGMLKELGMREYQILDLSYGVDIKKFSPGTVKKEKGLILFVGAIEERKGLHILLQSCKLIDEEFKLAIIGPVRDRKYFQSLQPQLSELREKYKKEIEYLSFLEESDLINYYRKASLFVCPSTIEEFGIVIIEALACGTPVIASRVGGIPFVVRDKECGILVEPGNAEELSKNITYLLKNRELAEQMGEAGSKCVQERFSIDRIIDKLEDRINKMLKGGTGRSEPH